MDFEAANDAFKEGFEKIKELEQEYVIEYWPWFAGAPFMLDDCKKSAHRLNEVGALAKQFGLKFLWHNHDNEFIEMEKGLPFDYLMENTDPEIVNCELDIYWV